MAFLGKQRTKSRTASAEHPTSFTSGSWQTDGAVQCAAIIRAAVSAVDARHTSARGVDPLGIDTATGSADSTIWVEQLRLDTWRVGRGTATATGPAYEWQLAFAAQRESELVGITVDALHEPEPDGPQVHKEESVQLTDLVLTGLDASAPPSVQSEQQTGTRGLTFAVEPFEEEPITPYDGGFSLFTRLPAEAAREFVSRMPFYRIDGPAPDRWLLGLPSASRPSWVDLTVEDDGKWRTLRFAVHLAHDPECPAANAVTTSHARRFAAAALALLREDDKRAGIRDMGELTHGLR